MSQTFETTSREDRYVVVSSDSHAGPSIRHDLRPYCPTKDLGDYDEFVASWEGETEERERAGMNRFTQYGDRPTLEAFERVMHCDGLSDPNACLHDMDDDGIAAQVIFAGGGNNQPLPWMSAFSTGDPALDQSHRELGGHIWNAWLADFVAHDPDRLLGVMEVPIRSLDKAIAEVQWGKEHGLRVINFPAPRPEYPPYNDPVYERFWSAVEEVGLPLACHIGSGVIPPFSGRGQYMIFSAELPWYSRRAFAQLAFGGVFDRHPNLTVGFTEQRAGWVPEHLRDLDSCYLDPNREYPDRPEHLPSEYWRQNCFLGASFMAHYEAELRHDIGIESLTWGSDYPHVEGTWGPEHRTLKSLRKTFAGLPHEDVRMILGDNGIRVYGLDAKRMRAIADGIGPLPEEIDSPLPEDEEPDHKGLAFRNLGTFA